MISIITPSFRQPDWLRLCARSVADQEDVQYEHIVQEGSDDPSVESCVSQFPKLRFYREPDSGMYDAINRGLKRSHGAICSYLNCDEQLLPNALRQVAAFFDKNPTIEVIFGDSILIDKNGKPLSYRRTVVPILSYVERVQLNAPTCATFFRRSIIDRGLLFDSQWKVIGDQVWIEDLIRAGVRMATLGEPLAVFTFTGQNLSSTIVSQEERARHSHPRSVLASIRRGADIIAHRTRKLLAGAYKFRRIEIDIYTLDSPSRRQHRSANVGFGWPKT